MNNPNLKIVIALLTLFFLDSSDLWSKTNDSLFKRNVAWFGASKTNYFLARFPANQSDVTRTIHNGNLSYSLGYDYYYPLTDALVLSAGCNYMTSKFRMEYSDLVTPNISKGSVIQSFRADRVSIPLSVNYKVNITHKSYALIGTGIETFYTTVFKKNQPDQVRFYDENGDLDKNIKVSSQVNNEGLSWFRTLNFSAKMFFNTDKKNKLYMGLDYYYMNNYFPMEISTNIFAGQKNFTATNNPNFEGLRFSAGYTW